MVDVPNDLKYTTTHEWARREEDGIITIGVTDHAQHLLGDIVFVELPEIGGEFKVGQETGVIESVKAASDMYAPLSGEVMEVNEALAENPALINEDPYHHGWIFKLKALDEGEWENLMGQNEYLEKIAEEEGA